MTFGKYVRLCETKSYSSTLTRTIPGSDFNEHAKEQLSFGDTKGLLLVLLLSKEDQTIAVL